MADDVTFPCESFREAAPHLRRPFAPEALKWRKLDSTSLAAYIDVRTVIARLNLVVPHLWSTEYRPFGERVDSGLLVCKLTIDGIEREDVGKGQGKDAAKSAYSDALKRAAVQFGVGHVVYAMKRVYISDLPAKARPDAKGNLSEDAQDILRKGYAKWLTTERGKHFGEPLAHGEEADSVGDAEIEAAPGQDSEPDLELAAARQEADTAYKAAAKNGNGGKLKKAMTPARFRAELDAAKSVEAVSELMERVKAASA